MILYDYWIERLNYVIGLGAADLYLHRGILCTVSLYKSYKRLNVLEG